MCRCAQIEAVLPIVGRKDDVAHLLLADSQFRHNAADRHHLTRLVDKPFDSQTSALRDIGGQHGKNLIQIMGIEIECRLSAGIARQEPLAHLSIKQVRNILHDHLLHTCAKLGVTEVARDSSDSVIGLQLQVMLRRVVGLGLGSNL